MIVWWLLLLVFATSWVLTLVLRRYALAKSLMDIPNERSSHTVPTPRGGGVAIVATFLVTLPILAGLGLLSTSALYALLGSGLLVAVIGFVDDHGHIAARWRLLGHFIAAVWTLLWIKGLPPIELFGIVADLGWFGSILAALYLVWMLNLYNFMDGIDGLASAQAISVCFAISVVYWFSGNTELIWAPMALLAAVAGFLCWNFPPAKIFMGDAGSGFLGLVLGILALQSAKGSPELIWSWIILMGAFIVDSTWTLLRRMIRGEKIYEAHRSHGYQHAADHLKSHMAVTSAVVAINLIFLLPLSILVAVGEISGVLGVLIAYLPLVLLVCKFRGGLEIK